MLEFEQESKFQNWKYFGTRFKYFGTRTKPEFKNL